MIKLKQLSVSMMTLFFFVSVSAYSKPLICPFTDHFNLRVSDGHKILNSSTSGNLTYTQQSDKEFTLQCGDEGMTASGKLFLDIGDANNKCSLEIEDGPTYWNPIISSVDCTDPTKFRYVYAEHSTGSYYYTLVFQG